MCQVTRRRGQCPCWSGYAAGSHEPVASKEIEDLGKLKDGKSLLSGLLFGFSAVARAPGRRKVLLPLQPAGYLLRCRPIDEQVLIRRTEINNKHNKRLQVQGLPLTRSCHLAATAPKQWAYFPSYGEQLSSLFWPSWPPHGHI